MDLHAASAEPDGQFLGRAPVSLFCTRFSASPAFLRVLLYRNNGFASNNFTWVGHCRMLVFIQSYPNQHIGQVQFAEFLAHLKRNEDQSVLFLGILPCLCGCIVWAC